MSITRLFQGLKEKKSRRVGRGLGSTFGKTAGRGTKGQKSRSGSGRKIKQWFEGGQTPLHQRTAKLRGFKRNVPKSIAITTTIINNHYKDGEVVSPTTLVDKGLIRASKQKNPIKIIAGSKLTAKVSFDGVGLSKSVVQP